MSWLRHPPRPAERLAQRLGFEPWRAEYLYSELKRRYLWLCWPGVLAGILAFILWVLVLSQFMSLVSGTRGSIREVEVWRIVAALVYMWGLMFAGGLHVGSLAKWHINDRAIRRFIAEFIDTPKCFACDYGLTGVPRSADGELRCPECTQNWPWLKRIRDPRPYMSAIDPPRQPDTAAGQEPAASNSR
jgi:hypothetical protein